MPTIPTIKFETEDVLDLALRYDDKGSLGESVLYFASELLDVSTDTFYELLEAYKRRCA